MACSVYKYHVPYNDGMYLHTFLGRYTLIFLFLYLSNNSLESTALTQELQHQQFSHKHTLTLLKALPPHSSKAELL